MTALAATQSDRCMCNEKNFHRCCVRDCGVPEENCYPCHAWRGRERCLQTGKTKKELLDV